MDSSFNRFVVACAAWAASFLIVGTACGQGLATTTMNPSAAPSDIRNPSAFVPGAAASDIRNPSSVIPGAARSDSRQFGIGRAGRASTVLPSPTHRGTVLRLSRRPDRVVKRRGRKPAIVAKVDRRAKAVRAAPPSAAERKTDAEAGRIMGSVCRGC